MILKGQYWQTGNIFKLSIGSNSIVYCNELIYARGYVPKKHFNNNLRNTDSLFEEHVFRVYSPIKKNKK